jgi:hypothetical protein
MPKERPLHHHLGGSQVQKVTLLFLIKYVFWTWSTPFGTVGT